MLEVKKVSKAFDGKPVLQAFSYTFAAGSRTCVMGPSGCGKTTLLRLMMGLEKPDSGEILSPRELRMSAVFQEDRLLTQLSAAENVALASHADADEIRRTLLSLELPEDALQAPVSTFSGGMKRRVALCRALLAPYDVLFLDEPYKGLDEATRKTVMALVNERTFGKTVILVTHDRHEASGYNLIELNTSA